MHDTTTRPTPAAASASRRSLDATGPRRQLALVTVVALLASPVSSSDNPGATQLSVVAAGLVIGALVALLALPWRRMPGWTHAQPAVVVLVALVVLRQTHAGTSAYLLLALLPVLWLSVNTGVTLSRSALLATALGFGIPELVSGESVVAVLSALRGVLAFTVVALVLDTQVAALVRRGEARAARTLDVAAGAAEVSSPGRSSQHHEALCQLARLRCGADHVALAVEQDGRLVVLARARGEVDVDAWLPVRADDDQDVARALRTGSATWTADLPPGSPAAALTHPDVVSVLWQPVLAQGRVRALLVLGYDAARRELDAVTLEAARTAAEDTGALLAAGDRLQELESAATTDPLTGLPNRRWLLEQAEAGLSELRAQRRPASVLMIDIDHFKHFNDTHGHAAGDDVLREFSSRAGRALRDGGVLARWGGEEFVVFLPGCTAADAVVVAERVRTSTPGEQTCSVGAAEWDGEEPLADVLARADGAMYRAKRCGRDRVEIGLVTTDPDVPVLAARSAS